MTFQLNVARWAACALLLAGASTATAQMNVAQAIAVERKLTMPDSAFWSTPTGVPGAPGSLIRTEQHSAYRLPPGSTASRILYWSNDLYFNPTVASAVLVKPAGAPPEAGWPLVVWARGATGLGRQCGASNTYTLGYNMMPLVEQGFAVLAVDYAGYATDGGHKFGNKLVNASDVLNAVPAAQVAVDGITQQWAVVGHSQGGLVAWGVGELQALRAAPDYLGAVALAPAVGGARLLAHLAQTPGSLFLPVYFARGIKAQYPQFDERSMLTPEAAAHFDDLLDKGCYQYAKARFADFTPGAVLQPAWQQQPYITDFLAINEVGNKAMAGPLLVAAGQDDTVTPAGIIEAEVRRGCDNGNMIVYRSYSGDHSQILQTSLAEVSEWVKDRFAGKAVSDACSAG